MGDPSDWQYEKLSAEVLKKPESYVSISYTYNETLSFDGTFDPAFLLKVVRMQTKPLYE